MLLTKTQQYQTNLATFCRTGNYEAIPGVIEKNVHHYRRLVFNNVIDSISSAFPLTKKLIGKKKWKKLVNRFFSSHNIQSPQIWYMPKEFMEYVLKFETELIAKYAFLGDLLLFEWLEIEVFMMMDIPLNFQNKKNLYYLNPEIRLIKVSYPIHLKNANLITKQDLGNYFISIHRNKESGVVEFTNLTIPFVDVLENLMVKPLPKTEILTILKKYASEKDVKNAFLTFETISINNQLLFKQ